jgi:hypothetical protein
MNNFPHIIAGPIFFCILRSQKVKASSNGSNEQRSPCLWNKGGIDVRRTFFCVAVDVRDHAALANRVLEILNDPASQRKVTQSAQLWANTHSIHWTVDQLAKLIRHDMKRNSKPRLALFGYGILGAERWVMGFRSCGFVRAVVE